MAVNKHVAASTQTQALSALLFLYREVLRQELVRSPNLIRAEKPQRLPVVLTRDEAQQIIQSMSGTCQLAAKLLSGSGLRISECIQLRVKDIDFAPRQIIVREANGMKDRVIMLPESLIEPLQQHLQWARNLHQNDLKSGFGTTELPYVLARKYPKAEREWGWQYVFPSAKISVNRTTGKTQRFYMSEATIQRAIREATYLGMHSQTCWAPYLSSQFCDTFAARRL